MVPHKGKGFRDVLRRGGYRVLLVDASRTSVQCSRCATEAARCHTFLRREGEVHPVHGLLLCQTVGRRDHNGAINIARLTRIALQGEARPDSLSRRAAAARLRKRQATRRR